MTPRLWLGVATAAAGLSSCTPSMLVVPVRVCVIHGATPAPANQPVNLPAVTDRAVEIVGAASAILRGGGDIGLLPYPDVRVIADPNPTTAAQQQVGDLVQDLGVGQGPSQEAVDAIQACDAVWAAGLSGKPPGLTLVFARDFPSSSGGVNRNLFGFTPPPGAAHCTTPDLVDPAVVRARWSIVKTHLSADQTAQMWLAEVSHTTAHELGHALLLGHGNGLDDDADGPWDEECDPEEYQQFDQAGSQDLTNLMHPSSHWGTSLSSRQRALARAVVAKVAS